MTAATATGIAIVRPVTATASPTARAIATAAAAVVAAAPASAAGVPVAPIALLAPRPPRRERGPRPDRAASDAPPKPKPKRLSPGSTHRRAVLDSLPPEQRAVAEQLVRGGMPALRQSITTQNQQAKAEGQPEINADLLLAMGEDLLPRLKTAEWMDRADAAVGDRRRDRPARPALGRGQR